MIRALPGTSDLLRYCAVCTGKLESVDRARQRISRVLQRFLKLSNSGTREFDVSCGPESSRKISSKIIPRDELRAGAEDRRHLVAGWCIYGARAMLWQGRKT
jgi:hypothetical protein